MKHRRATGTLLSAVCLAALATGAAHAEGTTPAAADSARAPAAAAQAAANEADAQFVTMMIPHHYQALVMSRLAPTRSTDDAVLALAERIDVEQDLEIYMMQSWQGWHDLTVTDAEQAYQRLLQNPEMLERMGMATPAEIDTLGASSGTAFDVQYLTLMIEHHQGAVRMLRDVIINGSDETLRQWATDMLTTQKTQIAQMEAMLADKTPTGTT
ncbi:DUF305 domain-containing protein [Streptomyces sp. MAR4 CNX-425]|uniref:DUF305 domain-containing protein n=1 Tax=Streptomyces sp. MAR4 CNX-425 TaxID=3406343 RepID=UPI003B50BC57